MSDSEGGGPVNESSVPDCEAHDKKPGRLDLATFAAALGLFGAIVGGLLTWAFDLDLVWQASGAFLGALLMGGFCAAWLTVVFRVIRGAPNGESLVKRSLRAAVVLIFFLAIIGAVIGGFLGAVGPGGGLLLSLQFATGMVAVALATVLIGFPLGLLLAKAAPDRLGALLMGALLGCFLGSQLWRAWFEVGPFNLGILVIGLPMAFAFFIMHRQAAKRSSGSVYSPDERRFLTWCIDRSHEAPYLVRLWDVTLRDERPIDQQLLDHQIRSGTHLDRFGHIRLLPFNEWRELVQTRGNP